jgi:hypothetical protein
LNLLREHFLFLDQTRLDGVDPLVDFHLSGQDRRLVNAQVYGHLLHARVLCEKTIDHRLIPGPLY